MQKAKMHFALCSRYKHRVGVRPHLKKNQYVVCLSIRGRGALINMQPPEG